MDKILSGIKAVQTLSRLNRAHPKKHDVFVLDFMNDADTIQEAFADYRERLDEDGQVDFKSKAKAFLRAYGFLSSILPYTNADWEKLSIFLAFLVPKLPAPVEEDLAKGILEAIDMDSYRAHKLITEDIPARVAADPRYQNARKNSDRQNAKIEHDEALKRVMTAVLKDDTELFKQFMDNEGLRRWMTDTVFGLTYEASRREA